MLVRVLTAGGPLDAALMRAAVRVTGVRDHIDVRFLLDVRWFEPYVRTPDDLAAHWTPTEIDEATAAFLEELDVKLDEYAQTCAEGSASFTTRRTLAVPETEVARAMRESDLVMLPHPSGASAEVRRAFSQAIAAPTSPLLVVAGADQVRAATVVAETTQRPNGSTDEVLRAVLDGNVDRIAVEPPAEPERFESMAPVVEAAPNGSRVGEQTPGELQVLMGVSRAGPLGWARVARRRLEPERNLLLLPAKSGRVKRQ